MKIANVADVHMANHRILGGEVKAGINRRGQLVLNALDRAYDVAIGEGCEVMVINGDLTDTSRPPAQHLAALQKICGKLRTIILKGNHDMESVEPGDHSLGPLAPVAQVVEAPTKIRLGKTGVDAVELWAVPFRPGRAAEWLPTVLAEVQGSPASGGPASPTKVLALHLGLQDGKTPPWLDGAHDSVKVEQLAELCVKHGLTAVYAGNWHEPKTWAMGGVQVVQIGTLAPTGWDNPGLGFGTMAIFDSKRPAAGKVLAVPGPRFLDNADDAKKALEQGCTPFVRLRAAPEEMDVARATEELLHKAGAEVEIVPDAGEAQARLRQAAGVARSADTVADAVAAYVKTMPIPEEEQEDPESFRAALLERVKGYMT